MNWEDLLRALEGDEGNGSSAKQYVDRGMNYLVKKQYDQALQEFNDAIQLDPSYGRAFYCRGLAHLEMRSYSQAENDFNVASRLEPRYAAPLAALAQLHIDIALEILRQADRLCSVNPQLN